MIIQVNERVVTEKHVLDVVTVVVKEFSLKTFGEKWWKNYFRGFGDGEESML